MAQKHIDKEKRGKSELIERLKQNYAEACCLDPILAPKAWAAKMILEINPMRIAESDRERLLAVWPASGRTRKNKGDVVRWEWPEISARMQETCVTGSQKETFAEFNGLVEQYNKSFDLCVKDKEGRWIFTEMKVSEKAQKNSDFIDGFFFGASANEIEFARRFAEYHQFCLVRYPQDGALDYRMIRLAELEDRLMRWHSAIEITLGISGSAATKEPIIPWNNQEAWNVLLNRKDSEK